MREIGPERTHRHLGVFADRVVDQIRQTPDTSLVHSHYWLSGSVGLRVASVLGMPLVHSFHTLGRVKDRNRRSDAALSTFSRLVAEEDVIEGARRIVASTSAEKEDLVAHYGADESKICVAAPGVDHDLFTPGLKAPARIRMGWPDVPTVLFAGRIQSLKGADIALEAYLRLQRRIDRTRLVIVGSPSGSEGVRELETLQRRVKEADLVDQVTFAEPVPHREMADVYRASDVVVVPSRAESFGLVAAEAQAAGVPVVAANVGGLRHVVPEGSGGVLVDGWDPEVWADAIASVLTDHELAASLAESGPLHAEAFSWDLAVERIVDVYRQVA